MIGRWLIIAAVALYLAVIGCVVWPGEPVPPTTPPPRPRSGQRLARLAWVVNSFGGRRMTSQAQVHHTPLTAATGNRGLFGRTGEPGA